MLNERNAFVTDGMSFADLRPKTLINAAAQAADTSAEFSRLIRQGRPDFSHPLPAAP